MKQLLSLLLLVVFSFSLTACFRIKKSNGGGQIENIPARKINPADIALSPGYKIEPVATGFTFPSAVTFDNEGRLYVIETGYSYGEVLGTPKLIRIEPNNRTTIIATGKPNGPWTGVVFHNNAFYVSEGGIAEGGKILRISMEGSITELVTNLPTGGDHHTNGLVIKDGYIYFGQGTATNAAVVGPDNAKYGWLKRKPNFHDIPCKDIVLTGENYESENALDENAKNKVVTGAYSPYGTPTTPGQVIKGAIPCTGAVMRIPINGGAPELVAWGFRNPFGIALSPQGKVYVTENGYDVRGSRPIWGAGDVLWEVKNNVWYGWPDYSAGTKITDHQDEFAPPKSSAIRPLLQQIPNVPPKPAAILGVHASANGFDFSRNPAFGFEGEAFVAEFGDMAPEVGKVWSPVGFKVVRVNVENGVVRDFAVNKGKRNGPASWLKTGGLERPLSVKFDPAGTALYVVDFGMLVMTPKSTPQVQTGTIWKITKQ